VIFAPLPAPSRTAPRRDLLERGAVPLGRRASTPRARVRARDGNRRAPASPARGLDPAFDRELDPDFGQEPEVREQPRENVGPAAIQRSIPIATMTPNYGSSIEFYRRL